MEMGDSSECAAREKIRSKLNEEKVKLWLTPYTLPDGFSRGEQPSILIERYSKELSLAADVVESVIEELRCHACTKLQQQRQISIRVKLVGDFSASPLQLGGEHRLDVLNTQTGLELKKTISEMCGVDVSEIKLIFNGRLLEEQLTLSEQNVKNGMLGMVLRVAKPEQAELLANADAESQQLLAKTRQAAEYLNRNSSNDESMSLDEDYSVQITNQEGKPIDIPVEQRKAVTLAMMLHQRGRSALKRREFSVALLLLLEADAEFTKCRTDILESVDNYALLCLDIVWCYLCLNNISALPDAEVRLQASEEGFRRCYGQNVERLELIKGGAAQEKALFVRLHILQGVLAFHQDRTQRCRQLLSRARDELNLLKVDENSLTLVMEMGFSVQEARLGLRACAGNIQAAVAHIMSHRERRKELEVQEKKERNKKRLAKKLGKTANGELVRVDDYKNLVAMGYAKGAACEALKQSNNDIMTAIQILTEQPELLTLPDPDISDALPVTQEMIDSVVALGFDPVTVETALKYFRGDIDRAAEGLMSSGGVVTQQWMDAVQAMSSQLQDQQHNGSSSSRSGSEEERADVVVDGLTRKECERMIDEEIRQDISLSDEDYLDLDLQDEESLLNEYQALLASSS